MSSKKKVVTVAITTAALTLGTVGFAAASQNRNSITVRSVISNSMGNLGGMNMGVHGFGHAAVADRATHHQLIADTIGITVATLQTRLAAGDSLATIAGAKTNALIVALVAEMTKEIDAAVAAGKITAAQATTLKSNLSASVTAMVNRTGGMHGGPGMGHGFGDNDGPGVGMGFSAHRMGHRN